MISKAETSFKFYLDPKIFIVLFSFTASGKAKILVYFFKYLIILSNWACS